MKENRILFTGLIVGALIAGALMFFFMQKRLAQKEVGLQRAYAIQYATLIDSVRQSGLVNLMSSLLEKVENELDQNPDRTLSDGTILQLTGLSDGFKPYAMLMESGLSESHLSPERGHLLVMLLGMEIDSGSLSKVLSRVTFAHADLKGVDLPGAQLAGANLAYANFKDAKLMSVNLAGANLRSTNLWGAQLQHAILSAADGTRADLSWADLREANLISIMLSGANLTSTDFTKANLSNATIHWAKLNSTFFNNANLNGADLLGSFLEKTQFVESNLNKANFVKTVITEANLSGALLDSASVQDECWLSRLNDFSVKGADEILKKYFVDIDTTNNQTKYLIEPL